MPNNNNRNNKKNTNNKLSPARNSVPFNASIGNNGHTKRISTPVTASVSNQNNMTLNENKKKMSPNPNKKSELLHRFYGITKEKEIFFVQIKENVNTDRKELMSIVLPED